MCQGLPRIVETRPPSSRETQSRSLNRGNRGERGQTIIVVAVAMVSLMAMAALAIDVVTLYVARSEMQRAADAAALAGAKAFVDSGFTSDPTNSTRQALAETMATAAINSMVQRNRVGGVIPQLAPGSPDFANLATSPGDPQVSVTLRRTDLPTFFSRIWGRRLSTVSATAVAEAYNASSSQDSTGNYVPITPKCVKPLLVTNKDPNHGGTPFVTVNTGLAETGIVGTALTLTPACTKAGFGTCNPPPAPAPGTYWPAQVTPNAGNLCPSCEGTGDLEQSIECCDVNTYSCGLNTPNANKNVDLTIGDAQLRTETNNGVQCLTRWPTNDTIVRDDLFASTGPARITTASGPLAGSLVTTSNSIANLPIIDTTAPVPGTGQVTVIGFLQVFIEDINTSNAQITTTVLNVVGCGATPGGGAPVLGGGYSPIPIRLIHN